jgi:hypothetical protein
MLSVDAARRWKDTWEKGWPYRDVEAIAVLLFDDAGLVIEHRDYWNQEQGRREPYSRW